MAVADDRLRFLVYRLEGLRVVEVAVVDAAGDVAGEDLAEGRLEVG